VFLRSDSVIRRLASLHWFRPGAVHQFCRYYQDAMTSCRPSRRTSLPSLGGTSVALVRFAPPADECAARGLELVTRWLPPGCTEETTGAPKFLGNPDCPFAHVQSTPAGLSAPDHYGASAWPLVSKKQRLPRKVFRSSIAWLSDWLRAPCEAWSASQWRSPRTTQDSLPAAGQALPDGLSTRKVPTKGFRSASVHLIPLSQASWRNRIDRSRETTPVGRTAAS
jgi:hypothetical protein